jgi:hypothetical protein
MSFLRHLPRTAATSVALLLALTTATISAQQSADTPARATSATSRQPTGSATLAAEREAEARYIEPPAPIAEFFRRDPNFATLDAPSPDGRHFLVPLATQLSTLGLMARPTY